MLLLLLLACATAEGTWEGDCVGPSWTIPLLVAVEEHPEESSPIGLHGDVVWTILGTDDTLAGTLTGERDGSDVSFDVDFGEAATSSNFRIRGSLRGSTLEGTLEWVDPGAPFGDCDFERD